MKVCPEVLLELSEKLLTHVEQNKNLEEAYLRASASRAYYAAFHKSTELAAYCPVPEKWSGGMHSQLICQLSEAPYVSFPSKKIAKDIRRVGMWLNQIRDARTNADYKLDDRFTRDQVESIHIQVRKILRDSNIIKTELIGRDAVAV